MSFLERLSSLFPAESQFWESSLTAQYSVSVDAINFPPAEDVLSLLAALPSRDRITVNLETEGGEVFHFYNYEGFDAESWRKYLSSAIDSEYQFDIKLCIDKQQNSESCTVYSYAHFIEDLAKKSLADLLVSFNFLLEGKSHIVFDVLEEGYCWGTEHIAFVSAGKSIDFEENRLMTISACRENAHFINFSTCQLLPSDFHIITDYSSNPLTEPFRKLETFLSLAYVSNSFSFDTSVCFVYFASLRDLKEEIPFASLFCNEQWYKIYELAYADGHTSDKLALVRNIVSLSCRFRKLLEIDGSLLASIRSNYMIYLKNNVSHYWEAKNKVGGYISGILLQLSEHIDKLSMNFVHNIVAVFVFILTAILPKIIGKVDGAGLTDNTESVVFLVAGGSLVYLILCLLNFNYRIYNINESFSDLKKNYNSLFSLEELNEIFDEEMLTKKTNKIKYIRNIISILWVAVIVVFVVCFSSISEHPWSIKTILSFE